MTKAIPDGYTSITPYLVVDGAARAIDFYKKAFGATEFYRLDMPEGKIGHAELQIGSARIMLADEAPEQNAHAPQKVGGSPVSLMLYVENVDEVFRRALAEGAKELRPVQDQFYGDRSGMLTDPFGHTWSIATHVEDVSSEEMAKRMASMGS
jgi:PhnB protein